MNIRFKSYYSASKCDFSNKNNTACTAFNNKNLPKNSPSFLGKMPVLLPLLRDTVAFGSKYSFDLKSPRGIPCAYCGNETVSRDEIRYITTLKGQKLADELDRITTINKAHLKPQIVGAIERIEKTAIDNPDKDAQNLLPIAYIRARNRMLIKQTSVYSTVETLAKKVDSKELIDYINKVKSQDILLKPDIGIKELSDFLINKIHIDFRKDIISHVFDIATKNMTSGNTDEWVKIINAISTLPSSKTDPDAYLVKYISQALRKDPKMQNQLFSLNESESALFFTQMLSSICSSAEHIKPFSKNGESSSRNYLVTHSSCNSKRGNVNWKDYMLKKPSRFDSVLKNLNTIAGDLNIAKAVPNFSIPNYLKSVKESISAELEGTQNVGRVENFLSKLSSVAPKKPFKDEANYSNELLCIFRPFLEEKNPKESEAILDKIFSRTVDNIVEHRRKIFLNFMANIPETNDKENIRVFLEQLLQKDRVLKAKRLPKQKINFFTRKFSDMYLENYDKKVKSMHIDMRNPKTNEFITNLRRKVSTLRKPEDFCAKMILDCTNPDGSYNTEMLRKNLEELKPEKSKK